MKTLHYALVGTGMMGHEHLRNLALIRQTHPWNLQVTSLVDPDDTMRESAVELAHSLGNSEAVGYSRLSDVPADSVDAYVVVSPNHTHHEVISALLLTGKPVLCEKPVCTTLQQCDELLEQLKGYPSPFWVAMEYRYMPATARFLQRLQQGDIGTLRLLSIREYRYPFLQKVGDWNRFSEFTGGTLVEKCCHHFDLMRLMVGAEPVRVFASGSMDVNHLDEHYEKGVPDIIDNALIIVEFDNGVRASLELCMFADGAEPQEQITAIGDRGKLDGYIPGPDRFWPGVAERHARVVLSPRDQSTPQEDIIEVDPVILAAGDHHGSTYYQHVRFVKAILEGAPVEVSAEDGVKAVRLGIAAHESIRLGQAVELQ